MFSYLKFFITPVMNPRCKSHDLSMALCLEGVTKEVKFLGHGVIKGNSCGHKQS